MTEKEANRNLIINLFVIMPLGTALYAGVVGWLAGPFLGVITAIGHIVLRVYAAIKLYEEDMKKIRVINND